MNFLTLKEDFYKRYETSGKFLHYTSYGALCTLLGHTDIPTAPSLCCTLSMRVEMFARKSGGNYVKIENTTTDKCLQYPFGTSTDLFKGKTKFFAELIHALENSGLKGAEILYNNTIPNFISSKHAFSAALTHHDTIQSDRRSTEETYSKKRPDQQNVPPASPDLCKRQWHKLQSGKYRN